MKWLQRAGFQPESEGHWEKLGLSKDCAPADKVEVLRSANIVNNMIDAIPEQVKHENWDKLVRMKESSNCAARDCVKDIEAGWKKGKERETVTTLGELSTEMMGELENNEEGSEGERVWATQLCRIWDDVDRSGNDRHWSREQLVGFLQTVVADPAKWGELPGGTLVMWPACPSFMGRVLNSLAKQPRGPTPPRRIELVVPCKARWGQESIEQIKDLWASPWLGKKYKEMPKRLKVMEKPTRYIAPGQGADQDDTWTHCDHLNGPLRTAQGGRDLERGRDRTEDGNRDRN